MIHPLDDDVSNFQGCFSRERPPIRTIDSGDTIVCKTLDAGWGLEPFVDPNTPRKVIPQTDRIDSEHDTGHCLVGPIAIRDAQPGMTLEVHIKAVQPGTFGINPAGGKRHFNPRLNVDKNSITVPWKIDTAHGIAINSMGHQVKLQPFMGVLGVTPADPGIHSTIPPRRCGGNIDCKELVAGSTLYLPIETPDALFGVGDGHGAQGDGEICGTAIECPMDRVELTLTVRDDLTLDWPRANTPAGWITFGFDVDLTEAMFIALNGMLDLMMEQFELSRVEAAALASVAVDLRITQIVNETVGVHAVLPHDAVQRHA